MPNFERSVRAPMTHPDEWIDFWGGIYLANPLLAERGVLFETFLRAPREILAALGVPSAVLRSQIAAWMDEMAAYLEADLGGARCSNGVWIEKLRQRRHAHGERRIATIGRSI